MIHAAEAPETTPMSQTSAEDVEKTIPISRVEGWVAEHDEDVEQDQEESVESEQPEEPETEDRCASNFVEVGATPSGSNQQYIPSCIPSHRTCFPNGRGTRCETLRPTCAYPTRERLSRAMGRARRAPQ
jgi:hypothetical protein